MNPVYYLRALQNEINFRVQNLARWRSQVSASDVDLIQNATLQNELDAFLGLFDWSALGHGRVSEDPLVVADMGARDFVFAPVFDRLFKKYGRASSIYGVEIDGYRRFTNFKARADFGRYHAQTVADGHYIVGDFLDFERPLDVCFFLHPFVTPEPPLRWGLPLSTFKPSDLFDHAFQLLAAQSGFLLLSNPSLKEFEISLEFARLAGFTLIENKTWEPTAETVHQKPRIGALFQARLK
jgi:hypothetical protein